MRADVRAAPLAGLARAAGDVLVALPSEPAVLVRGLSYDSRRVAPGDLFFCVPGATTDGHRFARQAAAAGAAALCVERPTGAGVPEMIVSDARRAMARVAAAFLGHPADDLVLLGVTGTNGKTTTAFLLESILASDRRTTGLIGTIETRVAGDARPGTRTTPESLDLQLLFAEMRDRGVDSVAIEVTSHALALDRVETVRFAAAAFTNLSQDHLDFHADMEEYFAAKRSLFVPERLARGAVNLDDPYGRSLFESAEVACVGFGSSPDAQVRAEGVRLGLKRTEFALVIDPGGPAAVPSGVIEVSTPLVGAFNVANCLAACSVALLVGIGTETIASGIEALRAVPGRFESIDEGQPFTVVVDYAHTPDSLDNVLRAARRVAQERTGRVVCAFGCGGDRDRGKRPLMGAVAGRLADTVIVTSDNPRSERPESILDAIVEGVLAETPSGPDAVMVDRKEAIARALAGAGPGDVVVIAGKGHETGQEFADRVVPFDDRDVARDLLRELGWGRAA